MKSEEWRMKNILNEEWRMILNEEWRMILNEEWRVKNGCAWCLRLSYSSFFILHSSFSSLLCLQLHVLWWAAAVCRSERVRSLRTWWWTKRGHQWWSWVRCYSWQVPSEESLLVASGIKPNCTYPWWVHGVPGGRSLRRPWSLPERIPQVLW